jgi:SAM-dependent methyltransferase
LLGQFARRSLALVFYRFFYLRDDLFSRHLGRLVPGPKPPEKAAWDVEYSQGYWEKLHCIGEQAHYAVLLSYLLHVRPLVSVLDVGCGEAILLARLKPYGYIRYTGVDVSEAAIAKCRPLCDAQTLFEVARAEDYVPTGAFDAVVFSESIYYFKDPVNTVMRYVKYLNENGVFAISLHRHTQTEAIRRRLKAKLELIDETIVSSTHGTWFCLLMKAAKEFRAGIGQGR